MISPWRVWPVIAVRRLWFCYGRSRLCFPPLLCVVLATARKAHRFDVQVGDLSSADLAIYEDQLDGLFALVGLHLDGHNCDDSDFQLLQLSLQLLKQCRSREPLCFGAGGPIGAASDCRVPENGVRRRERTPRTRPTSAATRGGFSVPLCASLDRVLALAASLPACHFAAAQPLSGLSDPAPSDWAAAARCRVTRAWHVVSCLLCSVGCS